MSLSLVVNKPSINRRVWVGNGKHLLQAFLTGEISDAVLVAVDLSMKSSRSGVQGANIRLLELIPDHHLYLNNHFEVPLGTILRFSLSPELQSYQVRLYCNYPKDGAEFVRSQFTELKWCYSSPTSSFYNVGERFCDLHINQSGPFEFRFKYFNLQDCDSASEGINEADDNVVCGYFVVEPTLYLNKKKLPFDALCIDTYVTKCLGPVDGWKDKLRVSKETGYNMIHFTPCQELGFSKSAYSLKNQHRLNPNIFSSGKDAFRKLEEVLHHARTKLDMLSISDVVWNHTANNSPWIDEHPECGFNLENSPHLKPAYVVDELLQIFSAGIANGEFPSLPTYLKDEDDLNLVMQFLEKEALPKTKLWEFYVINAQHAQADFKEKITLLGHPGSFKASEEECEKPITLKKDPSWNRNFISFDLDRATRVFNVDVPTASSESERIESCCRAFKEALDKVNIVLFTDYDEDVKKIIRNVTERVRYERLADHGPKFGPITLTQPLVYSYFVRLPSSRYTMASLDGNILGCVDGRYVVGCNGWVWAADPLNNFAAVNSKVYLVRDLIVWGDCIKLNYGSCPKDNPYLWEFMKTYTVQTAKLFDGFRIDNCHSTPIAVAEYLLDEARKVNPNLYVLAELFTGSDVIDNIFVNKLGLNSLVREGMQAGNTAELGRTVHIYGGRPVGSFNANIGPSYLVPSKPHGILMDCTHDNEVPAQKRTVYDTLPNAALACMAACAVGSTRGYDEIIPKNVDVVSDERFYKDWNDGSKKVNPRSTVDIHSGIFRSKRILNDLHRMMGEDNYSHLYLDHFDTNVISVTRECVETHTAIIAYVHTAFSMYDVQHFVEGSVKDAKLFGKITDTILEACLVCDDESEKCVKDFVPDSNYIGGIPITNCVHENSVEHSKMCSIRDEYDDVNGIAQVITFTNFPPGSVIIFRVSKSDTARKAVEGVKKFIGEYEGKVKGSQLDALDKIVNELTLIDLNYALYLCHEEGMDINGIGSYDLPNYGQVGYCGLQGLSSLFEDVRKGNDLAHPICNNLREGNWLIDYTSERLKKFDGTKKLGNYLAEVFELLRKVPRYLIPKYFDMIVYIVHERLTQRCCDQMSTFIKSGSCRFEKKLALGSVQLYGAIRSAPYPTCAEFGSHKKGSLAAGITHFATGYMRCWGRDTFISLRGMLLVTGRFQEAR